MAAYQCLNCHEIKRSDKDCCDKPDLFCVNDMPEEIKRLRADSRAAPEAAPAVPARERLLLTALQEIHQTAGQSYVRRTARLALEAYAAAPQSQPKAPAWWLYRDDAGQVKLAQTSPPPSGAWRVVAASAQPEAPAECNDNDSPWLICKPCASAGKCAKAQPEAPAPMAPADAQDAARFRWMQKNPEHESTPYYQSGKWRIPYEVSNAGGFGGGVGEMIFNTLGEAIDAAGGAPTAQPAQPAPSDRDWKAEFGELQAHCADLGAELRALKAAAPERAAVALTDAEIEAIGHRKAWRYKYSSDPAHSHSYTFNCICLVDFARAIERAHGILPAADTPEKTS